MRNLSKLFVILLGLSWFCASSQGNLFAQTANAGQDITICGEGYLQGNLPLGSNLGRWSVVSGNATFTNPSLNNTMVETYSGMTTLRWTIYNSGMNILSSDEMVVTQNKLNAYAGDDIYTCSTQIELNANNPSPGIGYWNSVNRYVDISNRYQPNSSANLSDYYGVSILSWTINNQGCISNSEVAVWYTTAHAGPDQTICSSETKLNSDENEYGQWSVTSGSAEIFDKTLNNTTITSVAKGTNVLRWTTSYTLCEKFDEVIIQNNSFEVNAGEDAVVCTNSKTLSGTMPANANGMWTLISGNAKFSNPSSSTCIVSELAEGKNLFRWTVYYDGCTATDEVLITNNTVYANAGVNQSVLCSTSTIMTANDPGYGHGYWSIKYGSGALLENSTLNNTVVHFTPEYNGGTFYWTIEKNGCIGKDEVYVSSDILEADAGDDIETCDGQAQLASNWLSIGTGYWTVVCGNGYFQSSVSQTTMVTGLMKGTNTLRWTVVSNNGCANYDDVLIYNSQTSAANAGADQNIENNSTTLAANTPASDETGSWSSINPNFEFSDESSPNSSVSSLSTGSNTLLWKLQNNRCSSEDEVVIHVGFIQNTNSPTTLNAVSVYNYKKDIYIRDIKEYDGVYEILDISGKIVMNGNIAPVITTKLKTGAYVIKISSKNNTVLKKLVIE